MLRTHWRRRLNVRHFTHTNRQKENIDYEHLHRNPAGSPPAPARSSPDIFEVVQADIPQAGPGEILVKANPYVPGPAMLGWMSRTPTAISHRSSSAP